MVDRSNELTACTAALNAANRELSELRRSLEGSEREQAELHLRIVLLDPAERAAYHRAELRLAAKTWARDVTHERLAEFRRAVDERITDYENRRDLRHTAPDDADLDARQIWRIFQCDPEFFWGAWRDLRFPAPLPFLEPPPEPPRLVAQPVQWTASHWRDVLDRLERSGGAPADADAPEPSPAELARAVYDEELARREQELVKRVCTGMKWSLRGRDAQRFDRLAGDIARDAARGSLIGYHARLWDTYRDL